jgi:hypothetical protein
VRNVKIRQNERIFGERRTEIQPFQFCSSHKTQCFFENCLFFYNQTATENITKFPPKRYFEHRLSDTLRKSKFLNNALLHTTIFEIFFLEVHLYMNNRFSKVSAFCHELFKNQSSVSRKASEYFVISFRNENFMIRSVADVAITEVTIWQQRVITSRDKKEEKI